MNTFLVAALPSMSTSSAGIGIANNISVSNGDGCKGCGGGGCICENAVKPSQSWALHFKDMFEQGRYTVKTYNPVWITSTFDNTGPGGPLEYEHTMDIGYEASKSTTITNSWTLKMGGAFKGLSGSASFTHAVEQYTSQSFSVHSTKTIKVTVPPDTLEHFYQRVVQVELELQSAPQINVDGNEGGRDVSLHGSQFWFDNPYGGPECQCNDNGLIHVKLGFTVDCFSTNPDKAHRDKVCP
jgi:hypothetical protein